MSASGGTGNSPGAEAGTETALQRFIAISYVQKQHDAIPADETRGFRIGDRVKRGTKKQVEYGYVVYPSIKDDKPSITVLWMRGVALAPKDAVVTYSDAELPKLDSFRDNYRDAARKGELPMHATFDMLGDAWYARTHACLAAAAREPRCSCAAMRVA